MSSRKPVGPHDAEFLSRLKAADQTAWSEFYQEYAKLIYSFISRNVRGETDVEDLVQDTYIAVAKAIRDFDGQATLKTFVFSVARRQIADFWRKQKVMSDLEGLTAASLRVSETSALKEALKEMPEIERKMLILRYQEGFSIQEVSEILGRSYQSTESVLSRARKHLEELVASPLAEDTTRLEPQKSESIYSSGAGRFPNREPSLLGKDTAQHVVSQYLAVNQMLTPLVRDLYVQQYMCELAGRHAEAAIFRKYATALANLGRSQEAAE